MFCSKCGTELDDQAKFCAECGTITSNGKKSECFTSSESAEKPVKEVLNDDSEQLLLEVRPVFISGCALALTLPIFIFFFIWGGVFFGGISMFVIKLLGLPIPVYAPFIFFALFFSIGIPTVMYVSFKKTCEKTVYRLYSNHLEYYEGFFNVELRRVKYSKINEVYVTKGIFQKKYGLGTISLQTSSIPNRLNHHNGIRLANIENPDEVYNLLVKLIEQKNN